MGALFLLVVLVGLAVTAFALVRGKVTERTVEMLLKVVVIVGALGLALFAASMIIRFWVGFIIMAVIAGALAIGQTLGKGRDTWRNGKH